MLHGSPVDVAIVRRGDYAHGAKETRLLLKALLIGYHYTATIKPQI